MTRSHPGGQQYEQAAARWLEQQGLTIVARNWRCRQGEIDVVARHGEVLVFVEVRARSSAAFGGAAASIGRSKRERLLRAARHYLATLASEPPCRFDALLFDGADCSRPQWLQNVFDD